MHYGGAAIRQRLEIYGAIGFPGGVRDKCYGLYRDLASKWMALQQNHSYRITLLWS